jgi:hypothetical protein
VIGARRRALCVNVCLHYELVRIGKTRAAKWKFVLQSVRARFFSARVGELSSNFGAVETQSLFRMASEKC